MESCCHLLQFNEFIFRYFRAEIINDLSTMVKDHLMMFYKSTGGYKPHRVIMYRDGVSEGQFTQVCLFKIMFFFQILYLLHNRVKLFLNEHSNNQSFPRRLLNLVSKWPLLLTCTRLRNLVGKDWLYFYALHCFQFPYYCMNISQKCL